MKKLITMVVMTVLIFLGSASAVSAQDKMPKNPNYKKHAYWVQMMDNPNVNYFEACEAFETFWEGRGEPEKGHEGEEHEKEKRSIVKRIFVSEEKLEAENYEYAADFKRFRQWKIDMAPFVQPDGSILSEEEQMEIWKKARE